MIGKEHFNGTSDTCRTPQDLSCGLHLEMYTQMHWRSCEAIYIHVANCRGVNIHQ